MNQSILTVAALAALTATPPATAHSFWLQPEDYSPEVGEEVRVDFKVGHAGDVSDWGLYWERIASFRLIGPDAAVDQQRAVRTTGHDEAGGAVITIREPGTYTLSFESNPSFSELKADRFNAYLENEGLSAIASHRKASGASGEVGTELYARRAKALFQAGEQMSRKVTRPVGQILEIVPLANPFALAEGDRLPLQVFWRGKPLEGAKVGVSMLGMAEEGPSFLTSADGVVNVSAPGDAAMLYTVTWGEPAPNDERADYFTIFASLTVGGE